MEDWNTLVRDMGDHYENRKLFHECASTIFRELVSRKIKDMRKFQQHLGPEYEQFIEDLKFPEVMVKDLMTSEFFELTLKIRQKYKR